jgi:hypothetical protein
VNTVEEEADISDNECGEIWNNVTGKRTMFLMMGTLIHYLKGHHIGSSENDMLL